MKKLLLLISCLPLCVQATTMQEALTMGQQFGSTVRSNASDQVSNENQQKVYKDAGVQATTVGQVTSEETGGMGVQGSVQAQFSFTTKPQCSRATQVLGLYGTKINVPCADEGAASISLSYCQSNSTQDCSTQNQFHSIAVTLNGKPVKKNEITWQIQCNGSNCSGSMSEASSTIASSTSLQKQGAQQASQNEAYNSIKDSYIGKDGYSNTLEYMKGLAKGGNGRSAIDCVANTVAGEGTSTQTIYSCDKAQSTSLAGCHVEKTCTQWKDVTHTTTNNKQCLITYGTKQETCDVKPVVTVKTTSTTYKNCHILYIAQGADARCPAGYTQETGTDMLVGPTWDDVRICMKQATQVIDTPECYNGKYYIARSMWPFYGDNEDIVPRGLHAHIHITNVYRQYITVTIINETTGKTIVDHQNLGATDVDLPFSNDKDQKFKFFATGRWGWLSDHNTGVMTLLIDHQGAYKQAIINHVQNCSEG